MNKRERRAARRQYWINKLRQDKEAIKVPIEHAIPELWSARILEGFQRVNVWTGLFTDISEELGDGNQIHLSSVTSGVTVKDYVKNTDIADPEIMSDADQVLAVDQQKYFNIYVDSVDRVQARPAMLSHFGLQAAREVSKVVDQFMFTTWNTAIPDAQVMEMDKAWFPADRKTQTDQHRENIVSGLIDVAEVLDVKKWPEDGRGAVIPPYTKASLIKYLVDRGSIGADDVNKEAVVNYQIQRLLGFPVRSDANMDNDLATAGTNIMAVVNPGAVYTASQIRQVVPYTPEKRFGDAVKGLFVYGAKKVDDSKTYAVRSK